MRTITEIKGELAALDIPFDSVEFYNHPKFVAAERKNPVLLETYCEYVASQSYSNEYLDRSRRIVPLVCNFLYEELKRDGKLGACLDFAQVAMKILERLGIWCSVMAGSLTIEFDSDTKQSPRYWAHFFEAPEGSNAAGHAWVMAPPFHVVDMTIGLQHNTSSVRHYLPDYVMSESVDSVEGVAIEDILDLDVMRKMRLMGHRPPTIHELMKQHPDIAGMLTKFHPFSVRHDKATLKYFPCRTGALEECFEDVKTHSFSGQTLPKLFSALEKQFGDQLHDPESC